MTALTQQALDEFEQLWREDHPGQGIAPDELRDLATRTLRLVELTYRPIPVAKQHIFESL